MFIKGKQWVNITLHLNLNLQSGLFLAGYLIKICMISSAFHKTSQFILVDFITLT